MRKLRFLLTLLLVAVGVSSAMAQSYNFTIADAPSDGQFALGTKWYTIHDGHPSSENTGPHYLGTSSGYLDNKGLQLGTGTKAKPAGADGYWCVVGNETTGYQFYNREKGAGYLLGILKSRTAEVTVANMYETSNTTVDTYWDFTQSSKAAVNGVNYWCVKVHGSENHYWTDGGNNTRNGYRHLTLWYSDQAVYGWGKNASNGIGDDGSAFLFEIAATELEINYVNNGVSAVTVRKAVPQETSIQTFAEQNLPEGYEITGTAPTKVDGTYSYNVNVNSTASVSGITLNFVDYITYESVGTQDAGTHAVGVTIASFATPPTGYKVMPTTALVEADKTSYDVNVVRDYSAISGNLTRSGNRYTEYVTLQVGNTVQKITGVQANNRSPIYVDMRGSGQYFTCPAGALIKPDLDKSHDMNAMQGYCYIDMGYDGTYSNSVNTAEHKAEPESDLKAWGGYQFGGSTWYNSEGLTPASDGNNNVSFRISMPAFTAPTTPGTYCMRLKTDWNNIDPAGASGIGGNGGVIVDVFLVVTEAYTATYVDGEGEAVENAMAVVTSGSSALNAEGQNVIAVGSQVYGVLSSTGFQVRDVAAINGVEATLADFASAAHGNALTVTVAEPYIQPGKYYTIQNRATNTYAYDNPSGTDDGANLMADAAATGVDGKHFFQVEAANPADAGIKAGSFYIKSAQTGRYVKTPSQAASDQALKTKKERTSLPNFAHWISNAVVPGNTEAYVLADAANVSDPTLPITETNRTWNTNANITKVVAWRDVEGDVFTPNSLWNIKRVPVITVKFQDPAGKELTGITFTADGSVQSLHEQGKVLATVRNFDVAGYAVVGRQLKEGDAPFENFDADRDEFYAAVAALTEDAEAIITLRPRTGSELDITFDIYSQLGEYWTSSKVADGDHDADITANEWRLTQTIEGVPADLDFKVTAVTPGTINNKIRNYDYIDQTGKWGIGFQFPTDATNNQFNLSVSGNYYILQYEMSHRQYNSNNDFILSNKGESTGTSEVAGNKVNITDTPCESETWFQISNYTQASGAQTANPYTSAVFFRVRIVNAEYLENSKNHGRSICWNALNGGVGYPKKDTQQWKDLDKAIKNFDAEDNLTNYRLMLQAYSRYISCRTLQTGDDCAVYTLSFIKPDGTKVLVNNGENGLEIVPYTEAARAEKSARWISHKVPENNKMVFVSKKDGKYLQAKTNAAAETGVSTYYDAGTTAFDVAAIHQDLNDFMSSATDEKLLGAVYLKSTNRVTGNAENQSKANIFSIAGAVDDNSFGASTAPMYKSDCTSAMSIEEVESGNTFNKIQLKPSSDGNYYASYYGFYPVQKPDGARLFYAYKVNDETGYLKLAEIQADVIRPNFPVIIISESNGNLYSNGHDAHLHIGKYTTDEENRIADYLGDKTNILKGTFDEIRTSDMKEIEGGEIYVLSGNGDTSHNVGFFHYVGEWMPIGKAYYVDTTSSGIRGFIFEKEDGEVTRIDLTETSIDAQDNVYDLSGRRVVKAQKGFYIVNGKKIIK